ncbi:hypothetical protein GCM10028857_28850 [Salinarchaeum chitinilyticum]
MADSHSSGDYSDVVSRRKFVSLAGTTGAAAVAGCLSGDGGGGDDGGSGGPYDYEDENIWFETASGSFAVDTFQYNPTVGWNIPHSQFGVFARWTQYDYINDEFMPHLITDWEHTGGAFVCTMSENFTWGSTGNSITAEDLVLQLQIQINNGDQLGELSDNIEASGEYELTVSYPEDTRQDFVKYSVLDRQAAFAPSIWEGEADNESPADVEVTTPDPSGPLALTSRESNFHRYEPRNGLEDYADDPVAGNHYNWNGYDVGYRDSNNAFHSSFEAGELDGVHSLFADPETLDRFPDTIRQFQIPGGFGMGIWPDHSDEPWSIREVRQALYYSLDRNAIIENVGASTKVGHPTPTGLTAATVETYLGSENPEGFNTYSLNTDKAESLLSDAGYSMSDINSTMTYPAPWSDWAVAAQGVLDQVQNAGWGIEGNGNSNGPGSYAANLGDGFDLAVDQHSQSGSQANIPYFSLNYILRNTLREEDNSHFAHYDKNEVEIDGDTINIDETLEALSSASSGEREQYIRDLALIVNKDVPVIYIMEKYEQSFIDTAQFDIPPEGEVGSHGSVFWPLWWLPQVNEKLGSATEEATDGLMKARTN